MLPKASSLTSGVKAFAITALISVAPAGAGEREIAVVGPISAIDCEAHTVSVLGVRFAADSAASGPLCEIGTYSISSYVSAAGKVDSNGIVHLRKLDGIANTPYVPGATLVYVRGEISDSNRATGTFSLSGAIIDGQSIPPKIGSVLEILGTQPLPNGLVVPINLLVVSDFK